LGKSMLKLDKSQFTPPELMGAGGTPQWAITPESQYGAERLVPTRGHKLIDLKTTKEEIFSK